MIPHGMFVFPYCSDDFQVSDLQLVRHGSAEKSLFFVLSVWHGPAPGQPTYNIHAIIIEALFERVYEHVFGRNVSLRKVWALKRR